MTSASGSTARAARQAICSERGKMGVEWAKSPGKAATLYSTTNPLVASQLLIASLSREDAKSWAV